MSKKKQETLFFGLVLVLAGGLFLVGSLGVKINVWHILGKFWPMILVIVGIKNIWQYFRYKRKQEEQ